VRRFIAVFAVSLLAASCGQGQAKDPPRFKTVSAPKEHILVQGRTGYILSLAWLRGGSIIFEYTTSLDPPFAPQIWQLRPDGTGFRSVPLTRDSQCISGWDGAPTALADGRLAVTRVCHTASDIGGIFSVVGYDLTTGKAEDLVAPQAQINPSSTSWNPAADTAIASVSSSICANIFWLKRNGPRPVQVKISEGDKTWRLDQSKPPGSGGCPQEGRADLPAWSPDGATVAFFGSPKSIGLEGQARLTAPWNLYLLNPVNLRLKRVLVELKGPSELSWSPDSQWLAFSGKLDHSGGLWLYQVASGKLVRIDTDQPGLLAWSPDGRQVAAIQSVGPEPSKGEFILYTVADITTR
jgi:hypothetical protein